MFSPKSEFGQCPTAKTTKSQCPVAKFALGKEGRNSKGEESDDMWDPHNYFIFLTGHSLRCGSH